MRVAMVRSDIGKLYTNDVESRVQRDFSAEPPGQSRNLYRPSNTALTALLNAQAVLSLIGTVAAATFNTTGAGNNAVGIKTAATSGYTSITVTSGAAVTGTQIASDLNVGFKSAGLALKATFLTSGANTNKIQIDSVSPNAGPNAYLKVDSTTGLATVLGLSGTAISGVSLAAFKAAVYVDNASLVGTAVPNFVTNAGANILRIRTSTSAPYSIITVTSSAGLTAALLVASLNAGFSAAGLSASAVADPVTGAITLWTVFPGAGPGSIVVLDSVANGSTLNTVLSAGWAAAQTSAATTGVFISSATLSALGTWTSMQTAQQTTFYTAIRDLVAPRFVETGPVLLSYVYGEFSKLRSQSFQPGGDRVSLPPGPAAEFLLDDGSAVFTV